MPPKFTITLEDLGRFVREVIGSNYKVTMDELSRLHGLSGTQEEQIYLKLKGIVEHAEQALNPNS